MWSYHTIRELAFILTGGTTPRSYQRTFLTSARDYRGQILLDAVLSAKVKNDDEARAALDDSVTSKTVFRAFKFRFVEELLNCYLTLDLLDVPEHPYDRIRYRIAIIREASIMLDRLGHRFVALSTLHHGIRMAVQHDVSDEVYMLTRTLHDLTLPNGSSAYDDERKTLDRSFLNRWRANAEVEGLLQYMDICHYTNIAEKAPLVQTIAGEIDRILALYGDALTDQARRDLAFIELDLATLRGDALLVKHVGLAMLERQNEPADDTRAIDAMKHVRCARAFMLIRCPHDALDVLSAGPAPTIDQWPIWQIYHETLITAHLHDGSYEVALHCWNDADTIRRHHVKIPSQRDHAWLLLGGNLAFLERLGKTGDVRRSNVFRLKSLLNSLPRPIHPDLRIGLPYLTLEIAIAIANYDYDLAQRRIEYAVITVARSPRIDAYEPYMAFVELLRDLVTCRFDVARVRSYSAKHRHRLASLRTAVLPTLSSEIIPFETLHDLIVEMIERNDRLP